MKADGGRRKADGGRWKAEGGRTAIFSPRPLAGEGPGVRAVSARGKMRVRAGQSPACFCKVGGEMTLTVTVGPKSFIRLISSSRFNTALNICCVRVISLR